MVPSIRVGVSVGTGNGLTVGVAMGVAVGVGAVIGTWVAVGEGIAVATAVRAALTSASTVALITGVDSLLLHPVSSIRAVRSRSMAMDFRFITTALSVYQEIVFLFGYSRDLQIVN